MSSTQVSIIQINFIIGKWLKFGDSYKNTIITNAINTKKSTGISSYHLVIHYELYRHIQDWKHISIVDVIQHINDSIFKQHNIDVVVRNHLVNSYINALEHGHTPVDVDVIDIDSLLFSRDRTKTYTRLDELLKGVCDTPPQKK
jgi:hypothetical protein